METHQINEVLLALTTVDIVEAIAWYRSMMKWSIPYNSMTYVILLKCAMTLPNWDTLFSILSDMRLHHMNLQSDPVFIPLLQDLIACCRSQPLSKWRYAVDFLYDYSSYSSSFSIKDMKVFQQHIIIVLNTIYDSYKIPNTFIHTSQLSTPPADQSLQSKAAIKLNQHLLEVFFRKHDVRMSGEYLMKIGVLVSDIH